MSHGMHQIGGVAEATGLSLRTIRHYEEVGLVPPSGRTTGGFRLYTDDDIERLLLIKHMKPLDFSLDELRHLLTARDRLAATEEGDPERVTLLEQLRMFSEVADQRCEQLRSQLTAAQVAVEMLRLESHPNRPAGHPSLVDLDPA